MKWTKWMCDHEQLSFATRARLLINGESQPRKLQNISGDVYLVVVQTMTSRMCQESSSIERNKLILDLDPRRSWEGLHRILCNVDFARGKDCAESGMNDGRKAKKISSA